MKVLISAPPPTPVRRAQTPPVAPTPIVAPTPVEEAQTPTVVTAASVTLDLSLLTDDEVLELARQELSAPVQSDELPPFRILTTEEVTRYLARQLSNDQRKWFTRKDGTYVRAWIEEYVWYYDPSDKTVHRDLKEWPEGPTLPTLHGMYPNA
jgi:hypothetical protein